MNTELEDELWKNRQKFWDLYGKEDNQKWERWREKTKILMGKYRRAKWEERYYDKKDNFRTRSLLASRLYQAMKIYTKTGKTMTSKQYGIDFEAIFKKLGKKPEGNYEIDHIKPLSSFNLNRKLEVAKAFAPENLQWLTQYENRSKGDRYED